MDETNSDDMYAANDPDNNPHEAERRDFEYSDNEDGMNWESFVVNEDGSLSSDGSDYEVSDFPTSEDLSNMFIDEEEVTSVVKGKQLMLEYEVNDGEEEEEEIEGNGMAAQDIESSGDELQMPRSRVQEHDVEIEKEKEVQFSEYEDSDVDIQILSESEDDENSKMRKKRRSKMTIQHDKVDYKNFEWKLGLRFSSIAIFKDTAIRYGIHNGYSLAFGVSDKHKVKVGAICKDGCPFKVYASWHHKEGCLLVKTVKNEHSCVRDMHRNRQLTSKWIAKQYLCHFKRNPHWPVEELIDSVRRRYGVIIKKWVAYKARSAAQKILHGSIKQHYNKLGRYILELEKSNKGSTFDLLTIPSSPPVFHRFFVCFKALKNGLLAGCRRFICLDGCHLKTFMGGILLAAIGRDGNNQMFPICWAVVEGENRDSWEWFLNHLKYELNGANGEGWTFMSDQQKGLLAASVSVFPGVDHKNCARHIYANWHKVHKGDDLKLCFWKAVRAYTEVEFEEEFEELKALSPRGAEDFFRQNPRSFCRAFLSGASKCDLVVSNLAETFNGYILKPRGKRIIDMLDTIRIMLMERVVTKRRSMPNEPDDAICPRIKLKLEKEKVKAWELLVEVSSETVFQVREFVNVYKVDVGNRSCTCKKWDITGIPCQHCVAACAFMPLWVGVQKFL